MQAESILDCNICAGSANVQVRAASVSAQHHDFRGCQHHDFRGGHWVDLSVDLEYRMRADACTDFLVACNFGAAL